MRYLRPHHFFALFLAVLLPGCGSSDSTLPDGVNRAVITVALDPNPVVAAPSSSALGYLNVRYKVVVNELSGLGGEFVFINTTLFDETSGQSVAVNNYDSADMIVFVGSKRLEGGQTVEVSQQIDFLLPTGSEGARITVNVQIRDDRGNVLNQSILAKVV